MITPAATVMLLSRETDVEVLLLLRSGTITFGGNWAFPGGRMDDSDADLTDTAVRETREEVAIELDRDQLLPIARWVPPPLHAKRFDTTFFVAVTPTRAAVVDQLESVDFTWCSPRQALARHARGTMAMTPPTWVMMQRLSHFASAGEVLRHARHSTTPTFATRPVIDSTGRTVLLWDGDVGYETSTLDLPGPRHRLYLDSRAWRYECDTGP